MDPSRRRPWARLALALALLLVLAGCAGPVGDGPTPTTTPTAAPANASLDAGAFREVSADVGLEYETVEGGMENGGVYVADYNRDGWPDLLVVGGERPVLFENAGGAFEPSGALPRVDGTVKAALFLDHDNDGWRDLLLLRLNDTPVFLSNAGGEFERRDAGFDRALAFPIAATAADYDGDGCLDVFVVQYADWDDRVPTAAQFGHVGDVAPAADNGNRNYLYTGDCAAFERVDDAGVRGTEWSLAASFVDLTGDGRPDIHVANDFNHDAVYRNEGDGTFERVRLGQVTDRNGMSSEVVDVDRDGRPDVFVTNIAFPPGFESVHYSGRALGNNLLVNRGNGTFEDRAYEYGVQNGGWGWAAAFADLDNDGDQDLFQATKFLPLPRDLKKRLVEGNRLEEYKREHSELAMPVVRERSGGGFVERNATRLGFEIASGTGVARLDFDRDGDQDLVLAQLVGPLKLYENTGGGNWIEIVVEGDGTAPPLGTRVYVTVNGTTTLRIWNAEGDFLSQETRVIHVGLGGHRTVDRLRIVRPDGTERVYEDLDANRRIVASPNGSLRSAPPDGG